MTRDPRRFRFYVVSGGDETRASWKDTVRRVDDLGYDGILLTDHVHQPMSPLQALAAAAEWSDRLRLGTFVLSQDFRNPATVARELATLDRLSDGRLEIGLGAGWLKKDYETLGIAYDDGAVRFERFQETVQVIAGVLSDPAFAFDGKYHRVRPTEGGARPVQAPRPPLLIGGGRPKILAWAARHADVVSFTMKSTRDGGMDESDGTPEALDKKLAWVKAAAPERFEALTFGHVVWECMVTPNPEPILAAFAGALRTTPSAIREMPSLLIGSVKQLVDALKARRERWLLSHVAVPASTMNEFAPVVAALKGT